MSDLVTTKRWFIVLLCATTALDGLQRAIEHPHSGLGWALMVAGAINTLCYCFQRRAAQ